MILFFRNVALISCLLGIFWGGYGEAPSKCKGSTRLECVDIDHDCTDDIRQCYYCSDTDALCLGLNTSVPLCNPSLCSTGCCNPEGCGSEEECMYSNTMASLLYYFGLGAAFVALVIIGGLFCYYRAFASKDEPPKEAPRALNYVPEKTEETRRMNDVIQPDRHFSNQNDTQPFLIPQNIGPTTWQN